MRHEKLKISLTDLGGVGPGQMFVRTYLRHPKLALGKSRRGLDERHPLLHTDLPVRGTIRAIVVRTMRMRTRRHQHSVHGIPSSHRRSGKFVRSRRGTERRGGGLDAATAVAAAAATARATARAGGVHQEGHPLGIRFRQELSNLRVL